MANVESERNPLEILAEEFAERHRRGEHPSLSEYSRRYPELADEIVELFPTILAMEQLKHRKLESGSGRASLGPSRLTWLGDYRIVREIGRGGMGIVYEAEQQSLGRRVAIKVLPRQVTLESKQLMRFQREAQTAARLHHTNIVPVYGVGEQDGFHYYAMQFIRGLGLDLVLAELKRQERLAASSTKPGQAGKAIPSPAAGPEETNEPAERGDPAGVSAAYAARAMLDGRFSAPRKPGSVADGSNPALPPKPTDSTLDQSALVRQDPTEDRPAKQLDSRPDAQGPSGAPSSGQVSPGGGNSEQAESPPLLTGRGSLRGYRYWRSVARIGLQVGDALQYAHSQGTLHRDIKPANLLLDSDGAVWVTDFGLARALENDRVTQTGDIVGTLRYMAPEQFDGESDARSDIYSLGLTLYELLTLQPAFDAVNRNQLVQQVTTGAPTRPRSLCPDVPRDLETIVLKAIDREPAHRYQSAGQLCEDLHRFLEDRTVLARRPSPPERLWRWCRRNRAVAALTLTAFSAILLAAVVGWAGYVRTAQQHAEARKATRRAEQKHAEAEAATARAEGNLVLAQRALEDVFQHFSGQFAFPALDAAETEGWQEPPPEYVIREQDAELLQRMLAFYDEFAERNSGNVQLAEQTARAYRRVGDIHRRLGDSKAATEAYRKALDTYESLAEANDPPVAYSLERAGIKRELSQTLAGQRQFGHAVGELQEAERLLLRLPADEAARPGVQLELVRLVNQMATMRFRGGPGRRNRLETDGDRAIQILTDLLQGDPDNGEYQLALAQTKLNLAAWPRRTGGRDSTDHVEAAVEMLERLVATHPDQANYKFALAETYSHVAMRQFMTGQVQSGRERLNRSIDLLTELSNDYDHMPDYRASLARVHSRLGVHLFMSDERDAALEHLATAVAMQAELAERFESVSGYKLALAWSVFLLARFHVWQESYEDARPLLEEAIETSSLLVDQAEHKEFVQRLQADALKTLAETLRHLNQEEQAETADAAAEKIRAELPDRRGDRSRRPFGPPRGPDSDRSRPAGPKPPSPPTG